MLRSQGGQQGKTKSCIFSFSLELTEFKPCLECICKGNNGRISSVQSTVTEDLTVAFSWNLFKLVLYTKRECWMVQVAESGLFSV